MQILDRDRFTQTAANLADGVVQPFIDQHETFAQVASRSVGTLRMTSVVESDGQISVRDAFLRFGRDAEDHVVSDSNVPVLLYSATGALCLLGYSVDWLEIDRHNEVKLSEATSGPCFGGTELGGSGPEPRSDPNHRVITGGDQVELSGSPKEGAHV